MMKPLLIVMSRWFDLFFPTPAENILSKRQCWKNDSSMAESCKSKSKLWTLDPEGMSMTSNYDRHRYIYIKYMIMCMYTVYICINYSIWVYENMLYFVTTLGPSASPIWPLYHLIRIIKKSCLTLACLAHLSESFSNSTSTTHAPWPSMDTDQLCL